MLVISVQLPSLIPSCLQQVFYISCVLFGAGGSIIGGTLDLVLAESSSQRLTHSCSALLLDNLD